MGSLCLVCSGFVTIIRNKKHIASQPGTGHSTEISSVSVLLLTRMHAGTFCPTWSLVSPCAVNLGVISSGNTDHDINTALCHSSDQGHHFSPQPQDGPQSSTPPLGQHRPQTPTQSKLQPGPQTQTWHPEAAWVMDINMVSGDSTSYSHLNKNNNKKHFLFSVLSLRFPSLSGYEVLPGSSSLLF